MSSLGGASAWSSIDADPNPAVPLENVKLSPHGCGTPLGALHNARNVRPARRDRCGVNALPCVSAVATFTK